MPKEQLSHDMLVGALFYSEPTVTILLCQMFFSKTKNWKFIAAFNNLANTDTFSYVYSYVWSD